MIEELQLDYLDEPDMNYLKIEDKINELCEEINAINKKLDDINKLIDSIH